MHHYSKWGINTFCHNERSIRSTRGYAKLTLPFSYHRRQEIQAWLVRRCHPSPTPPPHQNDDEYTAQYPINS